VDVCGTLFDTNTSAGLVRHHHYRTGNVGRSFLLTLITGRGQPLGAACILFSKITGFDLHRAITLATLQGQCFAELEASAQSFLEVLAKHRIDEVHERIKQMQNDGWSPVLVSNSVALIVKPIAAALGVPFVSSQLGWADGLCTGRLKVDLTGKKRAHLENFLGHSVSLGEFSVITDNKSDADLIDCSEVTILVSVGVPRKWMMNRNAEILYIKQK